jgi:hypothetical protein
MLRAAAGSGRRVLMPLQSRGYAVRGAGLALALVLTGGCAHLQWPWHHPPPPPPVPVHEVDLAGAGSEYFPQYWKRNTLLIDLSAASGSGTFTVTPDEGTSWPVRLAFRVRPGAIASLEVRGEERVILPISTAAGAPIDLELTPGVYTPKTPQLTVSFGAVTPAP